MKLVFMGSDPIALPLLDYLHESRPAGFRLHSVYTQPDRPTGRGMHLKPNAIKTWAIERGIPVRQPVKCGPADVEDLKHQQVDHVLVMAYGQILSRTFLETPPLGVLNLHASLLPRLRGPSPIHTAVALGLKETGVSLMRIIPKLDAGPVCDVETVGINPTDTAGDIHAKLAASSVPLLARCLPGLARGELAFIGQDEDRVSYCRIIDKADSHLDFHAPARELVNRVRAFQPWPGTSFPCNGIEIRVLDAESAAVSSPGGLPGTVTPREDRALAITCDEGSLVVRKLQRPGGKPLPAEEFLRGFPVDPGMLLESRPMRPLEAPHPFPYKRRGKS